MSSSFPPIYRNTRLSTMAGPFSALFLSALSTKPKAMHILCYIAQLPEERLSDQYRVTSNNSSFYKGIHPRQLGLYNRQVQIIDLIDLL